MFVRDKLSKISLLGVLCGVLAVLCFVAWSVRPQGQSERSPSFQDASSETTETPPLSAASGAGDAPEDGSLDAFKGVGSPSREEAAQISAETRRRLQLLEQILSSKNDNDRRLDSEFRDLSPEIKRQLRQKYLQLPEEDRNGRGTIVFLLGREINTGEDLKFFAEVLAEEPCQSFENCRIKAASKDGDEHGAIGQELTLVYPQMVAIHSLEKRLLTSSDDSRPERIFREAILDLVSRSTNHESARIAEAARAASQRTRH